MMNLLPPKEKKAILEEERFRLFLILGTLFLPFLILLSLFLLSIKIYITGEVQNQKILADTEEKFQISQFQDVEKEIETLNQNLLKLNSFYKNQPDFTDLIEEISQILPKGSYLTSFSLIPPSVSLQGFAPTRELLFELKKKLEATPGFKNVYFPPSNWAKPKDIEFSANFQFEP